MIRARGRRPLACYHEAGHAVARWWLGFHIDDVTVLSADEVRAGIKAPNRRGDAVSCEGIVNGYSIHMPLAREALPEMPKDRRPWFARQAERRTEMALVELYAGAYAEARYLRRSAFECSLSGGKADLDQATQIAAAWFDTEEEQRGAHQRTETIAKALVRSPKGWAAMQAVAAAVRDRGRLDGDEVDALCSPAYGQSFCYGSWDGGWPPTLAQIRAGMIPERKARQAA